MNGEEDETMVGYIFLHCAICFSAFALWMVGRNVVGNFSPLILFMVRRKRAIVIASAVTSCSSEDATTNALSIAKHLYLKR